MEPTPALTDPTDPEEQVEHEQHGQSPAEKPGDFLAGPTGHSGVDEVIASLDELDALPASDHVAVFEAAHAGLRDALSRAGDG